MAKGNQNGNVQGNWQQGRPSGMLGPNAPAGGSPQPMQQQQSQSGGYAYPWMQAGKWGDIGGSGLSGLNNLLSQFGQQQATGAPEATPAPSAPGTTTPANAIATDADPYAAGGQQQYAASGQATIPPGATNGHVETGQDPNLPGFVRPVGQGPFQYNGTPFTWDDGISQGLWTVPGTLDANNWPTLPDRSTWPEPPPGFTYGDPATPEYAAQSRRATTTLLTPAQVEAATNVPASWAYSNDPKQQEAYLNAQYGGKAILNAQKKSNNASNPMGATTAQDLALVLQKGGLLPANWGQV